MEWDRENTIAQFVRDRRKKANLTQVALSDFTGVGLRFIRELEQGKPNLMTDKVNQVLLFFGHTLTPTPISDETRRNLGK
ncbi:helix-turn-helix transcriptional regulator [Bizionia sediminis]|uniref:Helix-turn-helix transcriptional regulator n=1 Tax=Bizionia sediminis TaxID=1737064 RepID=A0ABW5KQH9_9FLAO